MLDTHCHIDLYPNPELILNECDKKDFPILSMTNLPSHFERGFPFFQKRKKVRQALGMHPLYAQHHEKEFPKFLNNLSKTSYIGEVGLDFSKEGISTKDIQIDTFSKILKVVSGQKKILSIHSRKAEKEVLDLLIENNIQSAIFHWYSGGLNLIDFIAEAGYYFSVNPAMVKSMSGRKIISKIPRHLLLTETDGPFIDEKNQPIKPGQIQTIVSFFSNEWKMSEEDVKKVIWSNFQNIISRLK